MASIEKRTSRDGKTTYRVKVRLKGQPTETASFERKTDASKWAQDTESAIRDGRQQPQPSGAFLCRCFAVVVSKCPASAPQSKTA